jgi:spore coat protein A
MLQVQENLGLVDPSTGQPLSTTVWGYNGIYPGPTIEARSNETIAVDWVNNLPEHHLLPIDPTIHGAMGVPEVRTVVHVHGAVVNASSDGYPEFWFTPNRSAPPNGLGGPPGNHVVYYYPNEQQAATLWYHDHALGITRENVYAGLEGFWLVRDPKVEDELNLPRGKFEIPLMIQDRSFNSDGSLFYPDVGINPAIHPEWVPEFFGDFNLVNGKAWPFLKVEPRKYRFRVLNGSNARFYNLRLSSGQPFIVIGNDRGYLEHPAPTQSLLIAKAERFDVILDFTGMAPGTKITLTNDAPAPFPGGTPPDPATTGQVMQFVVTDPGKPDHSDVPEKLNSIRPTPVHGAFLRRVTLNEADDENGDPVLNTLNNLTWDQPITELPRIGTTEVWEMINLTDDTHPIHLHLVQFQILNRQKFDADAYFAAYNQVNAGIPPGAGGTVISPVPYLENGPIPPDAYEAGWKETVKVPPGMVTRIIVKFENYKKVDPTRGNYVWHCHILEHEDNEMMRPYHIVRLGYPDAHTIQVNDQMPYHLLPTDTLLMSP